MCRRDGRVSCAVRYDCDEGRGYRRCRGEPCDDRESVGVSDLFVVKWRRATTCDLSGGDDRRVEDQRVSKWMLFGYEFMRRDIANVGKNVLLGKIKGSIRWRRVGTGASFKRTVVGGCCHLSDIISSLCRRCRTFIYLNQNIIIRHYIIVEPETPIYWLVEWRIFN